MIHIKLDAQDEKVKQFVLGLTIDPSGSILELNGRPVACVVPPPRPASVTTDAAAWTDAKNARRIALIKQKHAGGLSAAEHIELAGLQEEMLRARQKLAPLPLDEARMLHQELLSKALHQNQQV